MQIWTLSLDGNIATRNQTNALATALQDILGGSDACLIRTIRPKAPNNAKKLVNNTIVTWTTILSASELKNIACAEGSISEPWPALIVSCRPEVAALALGIKKASGGKTNVVHIQNPNDKTATYNFDLSQFDLILRAFLKTSDFRGSAAY